MENIFLKVLNMSITAGWLALAVMVLRLLLKKAPKAMAVVLWALVGIRLLLPFSLESSLSVVPSSETVPQTIFYEQKPTINSGIPALNAAVNPVISESFAAKPMTSVNPIQVVIIIAAQIWLLGMVVMVAYLLISYLRLRWRVREAARLRDRIWICDRIDTPFILGFLRPKIYLPSCMDLQDMDYVIAHERAHLKRRDHWWKPIGFLLLTVHWFNPLLWIGYLLLCRDIELACDEKVIRLLGSEGKKPYSQALIRCSVSRRGVAACPLAFGEVGVKQRIKAVLSYKKPAFWVILVAVVAAIALAVVFLTDPKRETKEPAVTEMTGETFSDTNPQVEGYRPSEPTEQDELEGLKAKYPQYFGLSTARGLEVYVWQMAEDSYSCALLPGRNAGYSQEELWQLHTAPATVEEMITILSTYEIPNEEVVIYPIHMPHSSYAYTIDELYRRQVEAMFRQGTTGEEGNLLDDPDTYIIIENGIKGSIYHDIDNDGVKEMCILFPGPTSGLFTFTFTVLHQGEPEYFNIFTSEFYELSFGHTLSGELVLEGRTQGENPTVHVFDVTVSQGNVQLSENGEPLPYWGEQGLDSPYSPKNDNLNRAIAEALQAQYRPDKPDGLLHCQSFQILYAETVSGTPTVAGGDHVSVTTMYLMVMYSSWNVSTGTPEVVTTGITPARMVMQQTSYGSYDVLDYQIPTDEQEVRQLFPEHIVEDALNPEEYTRQLTEDCYKQALNDL